MPRRMDAGRLREELRRYLSRAGPAEGRSAYRELGVSQPAFSRLAGSMRDELLVVGRGRSTRYAARRSILDVGRSVPVHEVAEDGRSRCLAVLHAVLPRGYFVEARSKDVESGFHDDLPWFLDDLRPAGFLGRLVPRRHPELRLPEDIRLWPGDQCVNYLSRLGWSSVGSLVVGDLAIRLHVEYGLNPRDVVPKDRAGELYPSMADDVMACGPPGSSAGGEQPKFLAARGPERTSVLVKFSPPVHEGEIGRRLADLLVCEHVAHQVLGEHGQPSCRSTLIEAGGRVFLEIERFDRIGASGRRGIVSLQALDAAFAGRLGSWTETASVLADRSVLGQPDLDRIRWLEWFGRFIGNSDMHGANLSFFLRGARVLGLAPAYDMLPMAYAPQHGQLLDRWTPPPHPAPPDAAAWREARIGATQFWSRVAARSDLSPAFRTIARENEGRLQSLARIERLLPGGP
ncbi:MAG: type II toxin-antitoxin system HipA family toxin YjjJ [Planctomycetes bacterium]|nr:type II toxin-antitoxin system HipA family toxin YjjJ [Planctomycetota bacterium]